MYSQSAAAKENFQFKASFSYCLFHQHKKSEEKSMEIVYFSVKSEDWKSFNGGKLKFAILL